MPSKPEKPLRLFVNPLAVWSNLALKAGEAMLASAHAAASRTNALRVAVLPTADVPQKAQAPKKARANPARAKARSKAKAKRRAKR